MNAAPNRPGGAAPPSRTSRRTLTIALSAASLIGLAASGVWIARDFAVRADAEAARSAVDDGRFDEARPALDRWIAARPDSAEAQFLRARVALAENRPDEIAEAFSKARDLGHPADELQRLQALLLVYLGKKAEAEPMLAAAFERAGGDDPEVAEALAGLLLGGFKVQPARIVLRHWIRSDPDDPRPHLWMAEVDRRLQADPSVLVGHYRAALDRDPTLDTALVGLARALRDAQRHDEAADAFARYLDRRPDDAPALVDAGRTDLDRGDLESARGRLDAALAIDPDDPVALRERAVLDLRLGDPEAALERLDASLALARFDRESWYHRSQALARLGRRDEAADAQRRSDELLREERDLDTLRKRLVDAPNDHDLQSRIARWLFEHDQDVEALRWANLILTFDPDHTPTLRLLADHFSEVGDHGQANYYRMRLGPGAE